MKRYHVYLIVMFFLSMAAFAAGLTSCNTNATILGGFAVAAWCLPLAAEIFSKEATA